MDIGEGIKPIPPPKPSRPPSAASRRNSASGEATLDKPPPKPPRISHNSRTKSTSGDGEVVGVESREIGDAEKIQHLLAQLTELREKEILSLTQEMYVANELREYGRVAETMSILADLIWIDGLVSLDVDDASRPGQNRKVFVDRVIKKYLSHYPIINDEASPSVIQSIAAQSVKALAAASTGAAVVLIANPTSLTGICEAMIPVLNAAGPVVPLLPIIASLIQGIVDRSNMAKYNVRAAAALALRVTEVGQALATLITAMDISAANIPPSFVDALIRLEMLLRDATVFVDMFSKRTYLHRMIRSSSDNKKILNLDRDLIHIVTLLQLNMTSHMCQIISLQKRSLDCVDIRKSIRRHRSGIHLYTDPVALQQLANSCGLPAAELETELRIVAASDGKEMRLSAIYIDTDAVVAVDSEQSTGSDGYIAVTNEGPQSVFTNGCEQVSANITANPSVDVPRESSSSEVLAVIDDDDDDDYGSLTSDDDYGELVLDDVTVPECQPSPSGRHLEDVWNRVFGHARYISFELFLIQFQWEYNSGAQISPDQIRWLRSLLQVRRKVSSQRTEISIEAIAKGKDVNPALIDLPYADELEIVPLNSWLAFVAEADSKGMTIRQLLSHYCVP